MRFVGLKDRSNKFDGFDFIQGCSTFKKSRKVYHDWLLATWRSWQSFEFLDGIIITDKSSWSITSYSSCTLDVVCEHALLELSHEYFISAW